jgi:hypothetical protein
MIYKYIATVSVASSTPCSGNHLLRMWDSFDDHERVEQVCGDAMEAGNADPTHPCSCPGWWQMYLMVCVCLCLFATAAYKVLFIITFDRILIRWQVLTSQRIVT